MIDFRLVQKPQRYIGNEINSIKKSHHGKIPICISYPDLYEIGMSNLGLRLIYGMFNEFEDVACERVFLPGEDLAKILAGNNIKLFSLETKTALDSFEAVGFNLSCELNSVNLLKILKLGGIPLKASERKELIVFAGGIANPEPLAEFVDLFYLGEFEEGIGKFVETFRKYKDKNERLKALSEIDGFYVPQFYNVSISSNRYNFDRLYKPAQFPLKRIYVENLDKSYYPLNWLTPHTQIIHDRVPVEIARGCPNSCTFCQARSIYKPYREKKVSTIYNIAKTIYKNSGYENISLLSLSASDYSKIEELLDVLISEFKDKRVGLSLPSLRIDDTLSSLYRKLLFLKKTSLTVALEAASDGLREKLGKKIDANKLFETAKIIKSLNLRTIKLYLMIGFPEETEEDLFAIASFLEKLQINTGLSINVSINIFVPKPFSLWETKWMCREEILEEKIKLVLGSLKRRRNINVSISQTKRSILEAILSRADRNFSRVIMKVFEACGYGTTEDWQLWQTAIKECGLDYKIYLESSYENFPWSFIDGCKASASQNNRGN
ncbi:MAG: TIGR03960 family B12-binding radical SAM protein [Candidatus Omnitrophica bacterium]|nr:TIGR03960 family B12-binding radical SAM protein [Candidatus Omnitrophota bacterium]